MAATLAAARDWHGPLSQAGQEFVQLREGRDPSRRLVIPPTAWLTALMLDAPTDEERIPTCREVSGQD
jgi:hypothetical protein